MVFGHNSNLKVGNTTLHVQTEDRGEAHALLDTTVYHRGRVLHRRTNNYFDLLPLNEDRQQALKLRLEEQHRTVMDEIRSGILELTIPPEPALVPRKPPDPPALPAAGAALSTILRLELVNAKTWLSGKHASLHIRLKQLNGAPVISTQVQVEFDGADSHHIFSGQTNEQGEARIEFDLPRIAGAEPALVIRAENNGARGHLRFALRAKPRVPLV
jgi:hypothetical protein